MVFKYLPLGAIFMVGHFKISLFVNNISQENIISSTAAYQLKTNKYYIGQSCTVNNTIIFI